MLRLSHTYIEHTMEALIMLQTYMKTMNTTVGAVTNANTTGMQPQSGPTTHAVGHSVD